jgi:hypothetical protein
MRPAKESPKARSKRQAGPSFVYGRNLESFGGSVLQKAAIVVRSKPPYKTQERSSHVKTGGTYDDVRVLYAFSQRISSFFPTPGVHRETSLPYRTEARMSKSHDTEDAMDN